MTYKVSGIENKKIKSFTDLIAWQIGHEVVLDVYKITKTFPKNEQYGLASQMRRSSVSVTSNIAEGFSRKTRENKNQFYFIAQGSLTELQSQLKISLDVGYIDAQNFSELIDKTYRLHKLINGLIKSSATKPNIPNTKYQIPNTETEE